MDLFAWLNTLLQGAHFAFKPNYKRELNNWEEVIEEISKKWCAQNY